MTMDAATRKSLSRAARMAREWRAKRDTLIAQAVADGASLREVADAVDLAHSAVDRIAKKPR